MTYDLSRLTQDIPHDKSGEPSPKPSVLNHLPGASDQNGNTSHEPARTRNSISRSSSIDSISGETLIADYFSSDDLDKLSSALSETLSPPSTFASRPFQKQKQEVRAFFAPAPKLRPIRPASVCT